MRVPSRIGIMSLRSLFATGSTACSSQSRRATIPDTLSVVAVVLIASLAMACRSLSRPESFEAAKSPEQIVFARSKDDIVSGGVLFTPPPDSAKPLAIVWIHGWGVNFYEPTYIAIGRA